MDSYSISTQPCVSVPRTAKHFPPYKGPSSLDQASVWAFIFPSMYGSMTPSCWGLLLKGQFRVTGLVSCIHYGNTISSLQSTTQALLRFYI